MAVTTAITKSLDNNCVQVDIKSKKGYTRYYKVPKQNARRFADEYKKQNKTLSICADVGFFASIIAGVLIAAHYTTNMNSRLKQFGIQTASAVGLSLPTVLGFSYYTEQKQQDLINRYNAREIFYRA